MMGKKGEPSMKIVKHYRDNSVLRASFNSLAEETFGLNFENWYQWGFWGENYTPYSVVEDGRVVANVSVNCTDMVIRGQRKRLYQLGTVMTAPEYRNRGYIRAIMAEIEKDIADADGVYLFANDGVVEFYPKFGFLPGTEYVYTKEVCQSGENRMEQVVMDAPAAWARLEQAMAESVFPTACHMVDNPGLIFFYVAQFMRENVFYCPDLDAWAIAEQEGEELLLHNVFATASVTLEQVIAAFGGEVKSVTLGFTPAQTESFTCREWKEEDCNFFVRGGIADLFAADRLRIPSLSHA